MEGSEEHRRVLRDLVTAGGDITGLAARLATFQGWDVEPLVALGTGDVANILKRFLDGHLSVSEVGVWADALEQRDDVDFGDDGVVSGALSDLASEGLGAMPITTEVAEEMLAELRQSLAGE